VGSEERRRRNCLLAEDNIILSLHTLTQRAGARERKSGGLSECVIAENHKQINRGGMEPWRRERALLPHSTSLSSAKLGTRKLSSAKLSRKLKQILTRRSVSLPFSRFVPLWPLAMEAFRFALSIRS
jgi:hypothetical protein